MTPEQQACKKQFEMQPILDPCCGSRMMWFDKQDQRCLFSDLRTESHLLKDRQYLRHLEIHPDVRLDFRNLPFADGTFKVVVFDPPHLVRAGKNHGWHSNMDDLETTGATTSAKVLPRLIWIRGCGKFRFRA